LGDVEIFRSLYNNIKPYPSHAEYLVSEAAERGNLDLVKYLHEEKRFSFNRGIHFNAARSGSQDPVKHIDSKIRRNNIHVF